LKIWVWFGFGLVWIGAEGLVLGDDWFFIGDWICGLLNFAGFLVF
jgi:hypothetical protein